MRYLFTPVLFLLLTAPLYAQVAPVQLTVTGDTITLVKSLPFTVSAPAGMDGYFWAVPAGVTYTEKDNGIVVTAAPQGPLTVNVKTLSIDWKNQKITWMNGQLTFIVGAPIPPADPLVQSIQTAYAMDADPKKAQMVPLLAKTWQYAATILPANPTVGQLNTAIQNYGISIGVAPTNITSVQAVVSNELLKFLPNPITMPTATYDPAVAMGQFNRIANALNSIQLMKRGK